jgi:CRP-like cAMP-binding protein
VFYVQKGKVKILVSSEQGKEAVVAIVGVGEFFGEGCLVAQPLRLATASAMTETSVMRLAKGEMIRLLHKEPEFAELFTAYLLTRNSRVEEDLVDQLFNSSEKRLARTLLHLGEFRRVREARADHDQDQPGDACGDGWYDPASREFLHEQVQEIGLYRIQRQPGSA